VTHSLERAAIPVAVDESHLTDVGNAQRLVARHGPDLRYVFPWSRWLVWDGRCWLPDETGEVERRAKETLRAVLADADEIADDKQRLATIKHTLDSERAGRIRGALELARSEDGIAVMPDQFDADPMLLNVANGIIDLRSGEFREHDRGHLATKLAPVEYEPRATAPRWQAFLERVLPDAEVRAFVQRYLGYSLSGSTQEQTFAILHGGGANGKSTLLEVIRALLGDYGQQAPAETFLDHRDSIPNDVARLRGARFVAATELAEGRRLNEALVKRMSGGDAMVARFMRGEWFEFTMQGKVWLASNHLPTIRGTDEAIWRRIRLVEFGVTIPAEERDLHLAEKLRRELPGILNWAIEGCLAWQAEGLGNPDAVADATAGYRNEMDVLGGFLADACVTTENAKAKASQLYDAYNRWAATNGERHPLTQQAFGRRLTERGFEQTRGTGGARWWTGIGIRTDYGVTE
jgi:putative DNA primase/helicase